MTPRKPVGTVVKAFSAVDHAGLRMIIKSQRPLMRSDLMDWVPFRRRLQRRLERGRPLSQRRLDYRIILISEDLDQASYYNLFSSCHICLAPSRWEGLGLHLYEAAAFGLPIVTNNAPPMNEWVRHQENGILVSCRQVGRTDSGIPAWEPEQEALRCAIEQLSDQKVRQRLSQGMIQTQMELDWRYTLSGFSELLAL